MKHWIGKTIIGIGILHTVLGLIFSFDQIKIWIQEGLFHTVNGQVDRELAYWFIAFGIFLALLGWLVTWCERQATGFPKYFAWVLSGILVIMLFIMPISGAWLMLIPLAGLFRLRINHGN